MSFDPLFVKIKLFISLWAKKTTGVEHLWHEFRD
jgi:hypothetical protein